MFGQIGYGKMVSSPSRTYVAMCNNSKFDGYYFRQFVVPVGEENNTDHAAWYFLNVLNLMACLQACFPAENFGDYRTEDGSTPLALNPQHNRQTWGEWWIVAKRRFWKWWMETPVPCPIEEWAR